MPVKPQIAFLLMLLIILIPIFGHLDTLPLQLWDESRLAHNALEMMDSHNWVVTTYHGEPDMWMSKPPLMIWLQILSFKILGYGELAVRFPSAMAALATCLILFYLLGKKLGNPLLALIVIAVLVTNPGYISLHGTRTGEYDSIVTMSIVGYAVSFFLFCHENNKKYLSAMFIFLVFAAYAKGIQGLIPLPALAIYALVKRKIMAALSEKQFYIGVVVFLFFIGGYYLLREHYNPGYAKIVWENELGGRFGTAIEGHVGDNWFYYNALVNDCFSYWYLLVIPGIITGLLSKVQSVRDLTLFAIIFSAFYLGIISSAQTKIYWYLLPAYPFLAIIVGTFIYTICTWLYNMNNVNDILRYNCLPHIFLFFVFVVPYGKTYDFVNSCQGEDLPRDKTNMKLYLKDILHHSRNIDGSAFLNDGFEQDVVWYWLVFAREHRPLKLLRREEIIPDGKLIAFLPDSKKFIEDNYNVTIIDSFKNVTRYQLSGKKSRP